MFDHSIAVLDSISRSLKKYLNIISILTQILFISYYAYLIVVNVDNLPFLIAYSLIEFFALGILVINISTTFSDLDHKARRMKMKTKRIIRYFSWLVKLTVIVFNIVAVVRGEVTDVGMIFLIFSSIFLLIQIILTLAYSLSAYYIDLLVYGLKLDYENLADQELASKRPLGKFLNNMTKDMDYKDKLNEYSIQHEVRGAIKKAIEEEYPLKINNKIVKKKKVERIIIHYYKKATKYFLNPSKLEKLLTRLNENHITYLTSDDHLFVLLFFSYNHVKQNYKGLSEYALKLIIATLLFIDDGNDRSIVDLTFKAITKELFDVNVWSETLNEGEMIHEYRRVLEIVRNTKEEYKKNREETILYELGDIATTQIEKSIDTNTIKGKIIKKVVGTIKKK